MGLRILTEVYNVTLGWTYTSMRCKKYFLSCKKLDHKLRHCCNLSGVYLRYNFKVKQKSILIIAIDIWYYIHINRDTRWLAMSSWTSMIDLGICCVKILSCYICQRLNVVLFGLICIVTTTPELLNAIPELYGHTCEVLRLWNNWTNLDWSKLFTAWERHAVIMLWPCKNHRLYRLLAFACDYCTQHCKRDIAL